MRSRPFLDLWLGTPKLLLWSLKSDNEDRDLLVANIATTKAEWIDEQAANNDDFDLFSDAVHGHLNSIKETALTAIEDYKAESGTGGVDVN